MLTETVTVERPGGVDRYGDPLTPTTRQLAGCVFAPRSSNEGATQDGQPRPGAVTTGLTMYAPPGAGLDPVDVVVRTDGSRWQVEGDAGQWVNPFTGATPGIEVALTRVEG